MKPFFSLSTLFLGVLLLTALPSHAVDKPNIIIMMADDMGYSDIGCYGGEIQTPNLNALAADGLRLTQFYNTARCCPTRASLLTGLYPHQAGVGHMMQDKGQDGYRGELNRHSVTIAEVLGKAGYGTYMSGKWHVTKAVEPDGPKDNWPRQRGFDRFFGTIHGAGSFYDPNSLTLDNEQIPPSAVSDDFYYTEQISAFASKFIQEHVAGRPDDPFFMYVAFTSPHWPMHARERDIAKYEGRYSEGWDALRKERHQRMIDMDLVSADWPLTPRDSNAAIWEDLSGEEKAWFEKRREVYAAMVDNMDQGIGHIVETLKSTGQWENTLIFFLADNGGCAEENGTAKNSQAEPKEKLEPMSPDELQTNMVPVKTRDGWKVRRGRGVMPGPADTFIAYGLEWANTSNTPFREYKHWVHEGGISTPLIIHWPDGLGRKDELEPTPGHLIDLMATCVDVSGADYPKTFHGGQDIHPMEGRSLKPLFGKGGGAIDREAIYWEHEGNRAVRVGQWKLVAKGRTGPWELYDMEKDRTELNDLSAQMPGKVAEMAALWEAYAKRAFVLPWPDNGKGKGKNQKKQPAKEDSKAKQQGTE